MLVKWKAIRVAAGAVLLSAALQPAAWAQSSDTQSLVNKIDRLQRELVTLQQHVYQGKTPPPQTLPVEGGEASGPQAARLQLRVTQMENQMRGIKGQVEEINHRLAQLNSRIDKLVADTDLRLRVLEGRTPSAEQSGVAPGGTAQAVPQTGQQGAPAQSGEPGVLGTVRAEDVDNFNAQQQAGASPQSLIQGGLRSDEVGKAVLQGETPKEKYDYAFGLLRQARYEEAEQAFSAFVEQHPDDTLAGNATYWLGETHYVRGDYQQAALTFADAFQQYPNSSKAPDNLLKLGLSLSSLGNTNDACGTFAELLKRYPDASAIVKQRATQERQRLSCP